MFAKRSCASVLIFVHVYGISFVSSMYGPSEKMWDISKQYFFCSDSLDMALFGNRNDLISALPLLKIFFEWNFSMCQMKSLQYCFYGVRHIWIY